MISKVILGKGSISIDDKCQLRVDGLEKDKTEIAHLIFDMYKMQYSVALGRFGVSYLHHMADIFNGELHIESQPESEHEVIY